MAGGKQLAAITLPKLGEGIHHDGSGLYFRVVGNSRSWFLRYQLHRRRRHLGLGSFPAVDLKEARRRAGTAHQTLSRGEDPVESGRQAKTLAAARRASAVSFRDAATRYIEAHRARWRNAKHANQWAATLEAYACPVLGDLDVAAVDTAGVLKVLEPLWEGKHETATRLRGRIEAVLDWATAGGLRQGENPARWRGHLRHMLQAISKAARVEHHAALPYSEIGKFMKMLRQQDGTAARALEFTILTAARSGEALGARWDEIDLKAGLWIVPRERIKTRREHRMPLSMVALRLLRGQAKVRRNAFVFPGGRKDRPLSGMAMLMTLRRMERGDLTVHGFRSTFRDWCAEQTSTPHEVAEMALAHAVGNKVEAAYRRGDLFEKRSALMRDWADWCGRVR